MTGRPATRRRSDALFLVPYIAFLVLFLLFPIGYGLWVSLTDLDLLAERPARFVGFANYARALGSADFWKAVRVTVLFVLYTVPPLVVLALGLALALCHAGRWQGPLRATLFLPMLLSVPTVSILWLWVYNSEYGLANAALRLVGLRGLQWLTDVRLALPSIAATTVWWTVGLSMVIYLAALLRIPRQIHEAALIDGASPWKHFWAITWPLVRPVTVFLIIINTIASFQVFGQTYIMSAGVGGTSGGPAGSTLVLVHYIYQEAFQLFDMGYGAAVGFLMFFGLAVISGLQWLVFSRRTEEWE